MSEGTERSGTTERSGGGDGGAEVENDRRNDGGSESNGLGDDHARIDPAEIGPAGALITVAFTGALIGLVGAGLVLVVGDAAFVFVVLGIAVVFASPVAYLRFRNVDLS